MGDVAGFAKLENKLLEDAGNILHHVIVPEADDAPAMRLEQSGAPQIVIFPPTMLAAIDLDDEQPFDAGEVGNVWANGHLSTEAMTKELAFADSHPQTLLHFRRIAA